MENIKVIRIYKPSRLRIVVSAVAVVQLGLSIVEVSTIANGVYVCDMGRACDCSSACVGYAEKLAPCVVGVVGYDCIAAVSELNYVPLEVEYVIVLGRCS